MTDEPYDLTALLGSRICHDLISPIGAIGNGLELISMSGAAAGPELDLVTESVQSAQARIKFYRIAYGAVGDAQGMAARDVAEIMTGALGGPRLVIDWQVTGEVARSEAKLVFLLLQCLDSAMAYGGSMSISRRQNIWSVRGRGRKFRDVGPLWDHLSGRKSVSDLTAAQIQFALGRDHAEALKRRVTVGRSETEISIGA